ncbi:MAG: hypothetical protein GX149_00195 [Acholeplasmataceae bacterium]|jgi:hypothetical protein|nr:hypothetical protein [Acholeplasmataceae bacterium]
MIKFKCELAKKNSRKNECWNGQISNWQDYGNYYELEIHSRSRILVILGQSSYGNFACMPDFGAGCHLSELDNIFYNTKKLCRVLGKVDGITVANAIASFYEELVPF